ncbi:FHA domain-containing protein [Umezakia ovalisporum]|jgi:pSer/pThr/pTyr-binding forkhead associated (FHA) protein|uniref:FHA domain-containing protein n=2 Tax=Umezakia ovalisporum TaxID=75695 RepID=A0AA43H0V4_9CYAN|nr:FHA domain-containing protein [Umezakia ovalisporum]MBI1241404.1 FHA domain-containing protein [Nostoc sp. RI_552]MDH6057162.1 FHA domain-containing protein [Umezakia ovalisporum FSS-43]MDH6064610.1 FHA domain-containing protein [Umezakia ovalisporum FSS-62]MDH6069012.1 FHA domain-containing protein [Umezakia ovalisporum APH033B]MDH6071702.1 FHA domain-containing protein [Umezakia ovalisporum CobakiLakeA]
MITCSSCGYDQNPEYAEFCGACGSELQNITTPAITTPASTVFETEILSPQIPQPHHPTPEPIPPTVATTSTTAKLISKQTNSPVPEFILDSNAIVGIFDSDTGPVDIDLETFFGGETVSRNHGQIYQQGGVWQVKDLGSTNGIFIKSVGQTRFGSRITRPETLSSGDEIAFGKVRFLFQTR